MRRAKPKGMSMMKRGKVGGPIGSTNATSRARNTGRYANTRRPKINVR